MNDKEMKPLPCPFCGEPLKWYEEKNCFLHEGNNCILSMPPTLDSEFAVITIKPYDIKRWNRRVNK